MTERKPPGMTFTSWIDQQISDAAERGAFDNLPGAGKPLSRRDDFNGDAWIADWVHRSGGSPADCLPAPLRLRKESELLAEAVAGLRSEQEVRDRVAALNEQILASRRIPADLPVFVPLVDEDAMVGRFLAAHPEPARAPAPPPSASAPSVRRRWWRRGRS